MGELDTIADVPSPHVEHNRRLLGVAATGLLATSAAAVSTTAAAALVRALGVDFAVPAGGESIPLPGIAFVTSAFSLVGVVIAVVLLHWSARPAQWFVRITVTLTALSLGPPLLVGASPETRVSLVGLHLIAAAVMIPALATTLSAHRATTLRAWHLLRIRSGSPS